jgi:hypothetical protein
MPDSNKTIICPRFIALDSSHLGAVALDRISRKVKRRQKAEAFEQAFEKQFAVLLLCWHHIQELLAHRDDEIVSQRVDYIKSLPLVATVSSFRGDEVAGSVIDLQAFEVRAAFDAPAASLATVRDTATKSMFRLVNGADLIRPFMKNWSIIRAEFARQEERKREVVAISRSAFAGISDVKIFDLLDGRKRAPEDIERRFDQFHDELSHDIRTRGDKRIADPEDSSSAFLDDVKCIGMAATSGPNPGLGILQASGIDISEIGPNTTVGDVGALAVFQGKLRVLNESLGLPWPDLKARVKQNRLPSGVIQQVLTAFRPDTKEWKGSDLTDAHLACLSAYADITYVDKRTHEAFRRAKSNSPELAPIVRSVEKAADYSEIAQQLAS